MTQVLLHGFWGQPSDWNEFQKGLARAEQEFWIPDLLAAPNTWTEWSSWFWQQLDQSHVREIELLGYSLGGRMALHAAHLNPQRVRRLGLISTHPGLESESEKTDRRRWEQKWQHQFLETTDAEELAQAWNSQEVFLSTATIPHRKLAPHERIHLAQTLGEMSSAAHQVSWPELKNWSIPTTWYFGDRDQKYAPIARRLREENLGRVRILPGAGHRLLVDAALQLAQDWANWRA